MIHADVLGERTRLSPGKTALVFVPTGERFTYRELNVRAERAAALVRDRLGIGKGERVGLLAHNRVEYIDLFFAAAKAGFVLVPLGTRLTPRELAFIVEDAGLSALVHGGELAETVAALRSEAAVRQWIALDTPARGGDLSWAAKLAGLPDGPFERTRCEGEDLHVLLYTSGTTGKPKGVMVPHRMTAWNGWNTALCWGLADSDVSPVFTPLYHAGGLGAFLVPILAAGGTIVLHAGFDPAEVWATVARERCTVVLGVPTIWKMLLEHPSFETADLSSIRWLISGGAPLPLYLIKAYQRRGVVFKQGYGLTEVGVNCFAMSVEESVAKKGSIGRPLMMTEAKLVDEDGREVGTGEVGELCLRGPHVSKGYWGNPGATAAALDAGGFFHTGDLARKDEDGFFTIAGRRKEMLISGGVNVYPAEIEGELLLHPSVQDAAVVGVPDSTWGEVGVAFVVARPGESLSKEALLAFAETRLARYKLPKEVVFVDALPRTAYGKAVKGELRERFLAPRAGACVSSVLSHQVDGSGEPLLLLNGGMMSFGAWDDFVLPLLPRYRVIRCDFRGQLRSPGTPPATFHGHAEDLLRLLDHLGVGGCHVAGTSYGAFAGLHLAARAPERVATLAAMTVAGRVSGAMWREACEMATACRETLTGGPREKVYDLISAFAFSPSWAAAHGEEIAARRGLVAQLPDAWFEGLAGLLGALEGLDVTPLLPEISCPVLVLLAEDDRAMPREGGDALVSALPRGELAVVPGSGHALVVEKPRETLDILLSFLARNPLPAEVPSHEAERDGGHA